MGSRSGGGGRFEVGGGGGGWGEAAQKAALSYLVLIDSYAPIVAIRPARCASPKADTAGSTSPHIGKHIFAVIASPLLCRTTLGGIGRLSGY